MEIEEACARAVEDNEPAFVAVATRLPDRQREKALRGVVVVLFFAAQLQVNCGTAPALLGKAERPPSLAACSEGSQ